MTTTMIPKISNGILQRVFTNGELEAISKTLDNRLKQVYQEAEEKCEDLHYTEYLCATMGDIEVVCEYNSKTNAVEDYELYAGGHDTFNNDMYDDMRDQLDKIVYNIFW